jgi:hypothetical protein
MLEFPFLVDCSSSSSKTRDGGGKRAGRAWNPRCLFSTHSTVSMKKSLRSC